MGQVVCHRNCMPLCSLISLLSSLTTDLHHTHADHVHVTDTSVSGSAVGKKAWHVCCRVSTFEAETAAVLEELDQLLSDVRDIEVCKHS
jgi:hypothetical protein